MTTGRWEEPEFPEAPELTDCGWLAGEAPRQPLCTTAPHSEPADEPGVE